jgi:hypothetical protein
MKCKIALAVLLLSACACLLIAQMVRNDSQMVRNDSIGNDPELEKLCAADAKRALHVTETVPFEINSHYVANARSISPEITFVATDGQLVECERVNGHFGVTSYAPEQGFWHLIRPEQFDPGIYTDAGREMAFKVCVKAAQLRSNRPNYDHSYYTTLVEVQRGSLVYHPGIVIDGIAADRYDIVVIGASLYKLSDSEKTLTDTMSHVGFTCLLSPMLDVKAIQINTTASDKDLLRQFYGQKTGKR